MPLRNIFENLDKLGSINVLFCFRKLSAKLRMAERNAWSFLSGQYYRSKNKADSSSIANLFLILSLHLFSELKN
jgi:hypothetical protein